MSDSKFCPQREVIKPLSEFHRCYSRPQGVSGYCKTCFKAQKNLAYPRYKARILAHSAVYGRTKRYDITQEQYSALVEKQRGLCAICGGVSLRRSDSRLCIDHDHLTKQVRGLLCNDCNRGLGGFKDDVSHLESAVVYLKRSLA